jgi:hypothetical protein
MTCLRKYDRSELPSVYLTSARDHDIVQNEFMEIKDVALEMASGTFSDCFKRNKNRNFHRTVLGYVNQMFQQVSLYQSL